MADPARLIHAFFADRQPTLKLPDGTWFGDRPNDVMHDLHAVRFEPGRRMEIELGGELVRRLGGGLRLVLDGAVEAREVREPGVHELQLRGFRRCTLEERTRTRDWNGGVVTFVGWIAQGQVPASVLG